MRNVNWRDEAACFGLPELFVMDASQIHRGIGMYNKARAVCAQCPVFSECDADVRRTAASSNAPVGFRAGKSPYFWERAGRKHRLAITLIDGPRLRQLRSDAGLTVNQFSQTTGWGTRRLNHWEFGNTRIPGAAQLRIARIFNIPTTHMETVA